MTILASSDNISHLIQRHRLFEMELPHWLWADFADGGIGLSKPVFYMLFAGAVCCFVFIPLGKRWALVPRGLQGFFEPFLLFIRDDVVYENIPNKKVADYLLPFYWTLFFFILFCNLIGLTPHSIAATGQISITGALAAITLVMIIASGTIVQYREARAHGAGVVPAALRFWRNLIPPGLSFVLWPLVFVIEIVGLIAKPFALTVRLFANMTGGHIVILTLTGFAVQAQLFGGAPTLGLALGGGITVISVLAAALFTLFEIIVALVQAYVFTLLTAIFVGMAVHPEH